MKVGRQLANYRIKIHDVKANTTRSFSLHLEGEDVGLETLTKDLIAHLTKGVNK